MVVMAEVVLFHHAQGLTKGVTAFADDLRRRGHTVHTPDLYDGQTFDELDAGVAHAREVGFEAIGAKGVAAAQSLPEEVVYAGISLGLGAAQQLAQTRSGARGAILIAGALPVSEFSPTWPAGLPVQVHAMEHDPEFDNEWDKPAAEALVAEARGELFLYPGDQHLFMDSSLPAYDAGATALLLDRLDAFLAGL
jgi:dienelactone hydrolase